MAIHIVSSVHFRLMMPSPWVLTAPLSLQVGLPITKLPDALWGITDICLLWANNNKLDQLDPAIGNLKKLQVCSPTSSAHILTFSPRTAATPGHASRGEEKSKRACLCMLIHETTREMVRGHTYF